MFRPRRVMRRRAVARTAAVGGAQPGRQERAPQEARDQGPPPAAAVDPVEQLEELAELREQGILTEEEFVAEKKRLLGL